MGIDRRKFMTLAAGFGAGVGAGAMVTPLPWQLLDDIAIWSQNWSWIPSPKGGMATFAPAVSKTCPSSAAVRIRLAGGRPVRVLPNAEHPLGGGVTSLAAAELQLLHSPSRVARPLKRGPDGGFTPVEWSEAAQLLAEKLSEAGEASAFISGDENGSVSEVISDFAAALGSDQVFLMPSEGQCASRACDLLGISAQLGYDLERSDHVLSIGANLLETWGNVVRNRRIFASSHPHPQKGASPRATLVYAGPVQNNTAAVADSWLPLPPGSGIVLALGIAHLLISRGRNLPASDFGAFAQMTADYDLDAVALATGLSPETIAKVVDGLLAAEAPLVIVGGEFNQGAGAAPIMAGFAVNALLGNINAPGGLHLLPRTGPVPKIRSALYSRDLAAWMGGEKKEGRPAALILHEANPAFALPDPKTAAAFLKDVPFKAAFSAFLDETAELCDLVLPIPMGLERVDDICNPYGCGTGIYCATLPVVSPGADARFTADVLLFLARQTGLDLKKWRGTESYEELIRLRALQMQANFDVLAGGFPVLDAAVADFRSCSLRPDILAKAAAPFLKAPKLSLAVWSKLNLGTPSTGIPPFNTKTLRSTELDGGDMFALVNSATARAHGIRDGRPIRVSAGSGRIRARARVFEGIVDNALALCLGYGHTAFDGFSRGKGANAMELLRATAEEGTELTVWHRTEVDVSNA